MIYKVETITASFNGISDTFYTLQSFKSGSLLVSINGQLKEKAFDDGWTELSSNKFKMKIPPLVGDSMQVWYIPI